MIIKQFKGKAFSRSLAYVIQKPGARFLGRNVFYGDVDDINEQMQMVAHRSAKVQRPMIHFALSLSPGERLKDHQWRSLGKAYLERMGYDNNQYVLVKHTDTPNHEHVHMIVNRVRWNGTTVSDSWSYYRSQEVARELEREYQLTPVRASWEPFSERLPQDAAVQLPDLPVTVQRRLEVQDQLRSWVNQALATSRDLDGLSGQLEARTVLVTLTYRQQKAVGIAFDFEGEHFAGGKLGKGYSLPGLLATLAKQKQSLAEAAETHKTEVRSTDEQPFHQRYYWELVEMVERRLGTGLSTQQKDFQLAMLALRSSKPDAGKALGYSPDIQRLSREQGEQAARDYLRQLLERAQQRLRDIDREKQARMERERESRRGQRER